MGTLAIRLGKTTLGTIAGAAGRGTISHRGDAAASTYWLCYTLPHQRIWILSHGEMGGPEHAVTEIDAQVLNEQQAPTDGCPALPGNLDPVSLHGRLWLGSRLSAVWGALGPPSYTEGAWQSFNYAGKLPGPCAPAGFDLVNWVLIKSEHGRVMDIRAGQVISC